jgi:protein-tyrosine-phosphatase
MAEAFFNKLSRKNKAISAGISPHPYTHSASVGVRASIKVMKEMGIKMPYKLGRAVTRKDVEEADKIIVLLDKDHRHILPNYVTKSRKTTYYAIHDSDERTKSFMKQHRKNRDIVKKIVLNLVKEIG